jgi:hypothetical protein
MSKPTKFEHNRFLGDKRTLVVHDLDLYDTDPRVKEAVDELVESERFQTFGPDTLVEARNRNYKPDPELHRIVKADEEAEMA